MVTTNMSMHDFLLIYGSMWFLFGVTLSVIGKAKDEILKAIRENNTKSSKMKG